MPERLRISVRAAQAAGHPELAGRVLERVREGGTTRYVGIRGNLKGRAFSRSLVERTTGIERPLPVSAQAQRATQVRRLQQEYGLGYRQAVTRAAAEHRVAHDEKVGNLRQTEGISQRRAERRIREAEETLRQPRELQSDEERTQALQDLGQIGEDDYYKNGVLIHSGLAGAA